MKNGIIIGLLVFLLAAVGFLLYREFAPTQKMAFVRSAEVVNEYGGMKKARGEFEQEALVWRAQVDTLAKEVQVAIQKYEKESSAMSDKEQEMARELITIKQRQLQDYQKAIQEKASKRDQELTLSVIKEINAFLETYGKEHNYDIIFGANEAGNVVYGKDYLDITDDVIKEMNK